MGSSGASLCRQQGQQVQSAFPFLALLRPPAVQGKDSSLGGRPPRASRLRGVPGSNLEQRNCLSRRVQILRLPPGWHVASGGGWGGGGRGGVLSLATPHMGKLRFRETLLPEPRLPWPAAGREGLTKRVSAGRHRRSDLAPDSLRELGQAALPRFPSPHNGVIELQARFQRPGGSQLGARPHTAAGPRTLPPARLQAPACLWGGAQ